MKKKGGVGCMTHAHGLLLDAVAIYLHNQDKILPEHFFFVGAPGVDDYIYLICSNDPFSGLVEDPFIVPGCFSFEFICPVVVPPEPQYSEGQQEWILISTGVP